MAHILARYKLALVAGACAALGLGAPGVAHTAVADSRLAVVSAARPGYQCVPYMNIETFKPGRPGSVTVRLDGYIVTYSAKGFQYYQMLSYPGSLKVSEGTRNWALPAPADPNDLYSELGGLCVMQFGTDPAPVLLAEGYSGGAHCCEGPTFYVYSAITGGYGVSEDLTKPGVGDDVHWNPNDGFQPVKMGTAVVLETSDGAFAYAFGCYACTPAPTRLFIMANGQLLDVTTRYPAMIRSEAGAAWKSAVQAMRSAGDAGYVEGPLAEWAADSCELNAGAQMWRALGQLQAQGKLTAA
jgi:hypothetical protein